MEIEILFLDTSGSNSSGFVHLSIFSSTNTVSKGRSSREVFLQRTIVIIAVSLAAIVASAAFVLRTVDSGSVELPANSGPADERLRALEFAVAEERAARQMLEEQLLLLFEEIDRLEAGSELRDENRTVPVEASADAEVRNFQFRGAIEPRRLEGNLLEAGLSQDRVDWIVRREEELRFAALQANYEARNFGGAVDPFDPRMNPDAALRAELGDAEYEKYLQASGRPTSVPVANVLASSPAASAGLQPGDEIVGYDGHRVFNGGDLVQQTMAGGTGTVVVDVLRGGAPMQVVVPRGPIGVEIGRFSRR